MSFKASLVVRIAVVALSLFFLFASAEPNANRLHSAITDAAHRKLSHANVEPIEMESNRRRGPALTQLAGYIKQGSSRVSFANARANAKNSGNNPQN